MFDGEHEREVVMDLWEWPELGTVFRGWWWWWCGGGGGGGWLARGC